MNQYERSSQTPPAPLQVYRPEEIAAILRISKRSAYNLCGNAPFRVLRIGGSVRVHKQSFDDWFNRTGSED